jgi:hypothetical protein
MDSDKEALKMDSDLLSPPVAETPQVDSFRFETEKQAPKDNEETSAVQHQAQRQRHYHTPVDEEHDIITVVRVERPVFTRQDFIAKYNYRPGHRPGSSGSAASHPGEILPKTVMRHIHQRLKGRRCKITPSGECFTKAVASLFPFVNIMRQYKIRSDLINDVMAGLIVGVMNIPQGTF